jgi:MFS family permease
MRTSFSFWGGCGACSDTDTCRPPRPDQARGLARDLTPVLACQFLSVAALVAAVRFLPLYLRDLGESESGAIAWTGILLSGGALGQLLATPVWGVVADRTGPQAMAQRAVAAGAGVVALMALATQAWHLLVLRLVQGVASGVVPAMITLTTSLMPPARLGLGLGLLQTAQSTGTSLGPLLGGAASAWLGYRGAFLLIAGLLVGVTLLMGPLVRDPARAPARAEHRTSIREEIAAAMHSSAARPPILAALAFQAAYVLSWSLLPLQLESLETALGVR